MYFFKISYNVRRRLVSRQMTKRITKVSHKNAIVKFLYKITNFAFKIT